MDAHFIIVYLRIFKKVLGRNNGLIFIDITLGVETGAKVGSDDTNIFSKPGPLRFLQFIICPVNNTDIMFLPDGNHQAVFDPRTQLQVRTDKYQAVLRTSNQFSSRWLTPAVFRKWAMDIGFLANAITAFAP